MAYRYRLSYRDGEDAGDFVTATPEWDVGDTFRTGDGRKLRILRIVPVERIEEFIDKAIYGVWEVEPV